MPNRLPLITDCDQQHLSCRCQLRITMLMPLCPLLSVLATPSFSLTDIRSQMTTIVGAFAGQKTQAQHPEQVLASLNETLCGKFDEHFATAAYLYADLDAKIVRYAGAGHPPLLVGSRSTGEARSIEQNGLLLGMFPEAVYSSIEIPLQQGDRYLLFTDGLPESTNAKQEEFGASRCKQFLEAHSRLPAAAIADELLCEIARWSARSSGHLQEDDMTLIVVDCQGQS